MFKLRQSPSRLFPNNTCCSQYLKKICILSSTSCVQKQTDFIHLQHQLSQSVKLLEDSSETAYSTSLKYLLEVNITEN